MATIDASIPLGVRPVQIESPVNQLAKVLQIQGLQQDQQLGRMKLDEYQQGLERTNRLNQLLSSGADAEGLRRGGFLKESMDLEKNASEVAHKKSESSKNSAEVALKKVGLYRDAVNGVNDPASAAAYIRAMHADPDLKGSAITAVPVEQLVAQVPQDPAQFAEFKRRFTLGAEKFMVDERQRQQLAETGRHNQTTEANAQGQLRVAQGNLNLRGQELENTKNAPRGQFIETPNGYMLADPKTGAVRPVLGPDGQPLKGKAADKSLTDAQGKANLFGSRMKEADRILTSLEGKYWPGAVNAKMAAGDVPIVGGVAGYAGNAMLTEQGQQAEQAQRDFINAVLRRESGAVISPQEFANAQKQYFPQPNDKPANLEQKRRNRLLAISGMEAEVPGGFRTAPSLTSTGQQGGSGGREASGKVGDVTGQSLLDAADAIIRGGK